MRKALELYLHIPFCVQKCKYCDFHSGPASLERQQAYVEDLCKKIRGYKELGENYHVISIFVGGGTPSILTAAQMTDVFRAIHGTFQIDADAEITIEMNPGTVTKEKLLAYRQAGINRLSMGLQSANNRELKELGRIHTYEEFLESYQMARDAGFTNINVDLMSAIPFQTVQGYEDTLRKVADLNPEHISAYSLIIEEGTPFYERYKDSMNEEEDYPGLYQKELPSEEEERQMYEKTKIVLGEYGFERYEISNYAKPGYACRHNLGYWNRTEYLGIGEGAASLINNQRWTQGEEPQTLSEKEQMEEFMFLGLRKMEGVSMSAFEAYFYQSIDEIYQAVIEQLQKQELLEVKGGYVRLTEHGIDVSNYVMSEFLFE